MRQKGFFTMSAQTARRLSAMVIAMVSAGYIADFAMPDMPRALALGAGLLKICALLGALALFLGHDTQDEDARAGWGGAFALTHRMMIGVLIAAIFYLAVGRRLGFRMPEMPQIEEAITVFTLLSMALPAMNMAFSKR